VHPFEVAAKNRSRAAGIAIDLVGLKSDFSQGRIGGPALRSTILQTEQWSQAKYLRIQQVFTGFLLHQDRTF
jgi:hypothetical protein